MAIQIKTFSTGDYAWQSWSNGYKIALTLTEESIDPATNASVVSYAFTISNTDNNRFTSNDYSWTISIGGKTIQISHFNFDLSSNFTTQTIASGQLTVTHNADGSLNMPYDVSIPNVQNWTSYGPPAMALTGTWPLTSIPRKSTISCSEAYIEEKPVITINRASSEFTHTLKYSFGSLSGTIVSKTSAAPYTQWTVPADFYGQIPNTQSGTGVITCETYSGTSKIGESTCSFRVHVKESTNKPVLNASVVDGNAVTVALTGNSGKLIRYYSDAVASASYSAKNSATISGYSVRNGSQTETMTPCTFSAVENSSFVFTVEDSRGFTTSVTKTPEIVPYVKLTCNLANTRPDASGNMTVACSGNYFNGSFGAATNRINALQFRYKEQGGTYGGWIEMTKTINGNSYTASYALTGLDYQKTYVFQARVQDVLTYRFGSAVYTPEYTVKSVPVFDWGKDDFQFHVPVKFNGSLTYGSVAAHLFLTQATGSLDVNYITGPGAYRIGSDAPNMPFAGGGGLLVFGVPGLFTMQMALNYSGEKRYTRMNWYGTWYSWQAL